MNNIVFNFLTELTKNNHKEWFDAHKNDYEAAKAAVNTVCETIYNEIALNDTLSPMKIYRIYRDLRFSKDKTPYKTHFGCYFQRKQPHYRGGYYIHISPEESFVGGGFFNPCKEDLLRIRQEISLDGDTFAQIMQHPEVVAQFGGKLWGDEVKTAPKGFEKDDPMLDYLRKKQFLLKHDFTPAEVLSPDFAAKAISSLKAMRPFFDFMTGALTTDLNGEPLF